MLIIEMNRLSSTYKRICICLVAAAFWWSFFQDLPGAYCQDLAPRRKTSIPYKPGSLKVEPFNKSYGVGGSSYLQKTLPNGLKLIVQEKPDTGIVSMVISIKAGAFEEMESLPGITSLIARLVLRGGGTGRHIPLQEMAEADGCMISAGAEPDMAQIIITSTPEDFRVNFKRLVEVLKNPDFSEEALEREKDKLLYGLKNNRSTYQAISEMFLKEFYRYHPYRTPPYGGESGVKKIDAGRVKEYYANNFTANRMTVAVVGDVQGREIMDMAERVLSDLPSRPAREVDIPWEPVGQEKKIYLATYANMAWLFVGFPAPGVKSPDYPKMRVLSAVLGEGLSSRLFIELREKEGLAYSLSSVFPELEGPSHMIVFVVTDQKNLYRNRKKLFVEINRLKKDGVTEEELIIAKRKAAGQFLMKQETSSQEARSLAFYSCLGMGKDYEQVLTQRIQRVTREEVREMAVKYLANFTLLMIESVPPGSMQEEY
jgi:predicted Zn-dependent peptidase